MKRMTVGICLIVITIFLAGCSIPFVDELLEMSTEENSSKNNEDNSSENGSNGEENDVTNNNELEEDGDEAQAKFGGENEGKSQSADNNHDGDENEQPSSTDNNESQANNKIDTNEKGEQCEAQDHSEVIDLIEEDFHIPECAILTNISKTANDLTASFIIENGKWDEVFIEYTDFFADNIHEDSKNIQQEIGEIIAYLLPEQEGRVRLVIRQGNETVDIDLTYSFPKEDE